MTTKKPTLKKNYRQLSDELTQIMAWFEGGDIDLDQALIKYEEAMSVLAQMESHLKSAENKVKKIVLSIK